MRRITRTKRRSSSTTRRLGIVGLETAVPLCFDRLVHTGVIGLDRMVELLTSGPARVLGLPGGTLREGGIGRPHDSGA